MADAAAVAQIDQSKAAALAAIAQGGTAGLAAYNAGQAQLAAGQQQSVVRAAGRAALIGGPEAAGFENISNESYGRGIANMQSASASFAADMARRSGANGNYFEQVRAAVPIQAAATASKLAGLQIVADGKKAEKAAAKAKDDLPTLQELLGLASQTRDQANIDISKLPMLDPAKGGMNVQAAALLKPTSPDGKPVAPKSVPGSTLRASSMPLNELAALAGQAAGVPQQTLDGLYAPAIQAATQSAEYKIANPTVAKAPAPSPDEKWLTSNVRGVDTKKAQEILNAPEFKMAGTAAADIANAPVDAEGLVSGDYEDGRYEGLTPLQAFQKWMLAQQGTLTMKDAMVQYYGSTLGKLDNK